MHTSGRIINVPAWFSFTVALFYVYMYTYYNGVICNLYFNGETPQNISLTRKLARDKCKLVLTMIRQLDLTIVGSIAPLMVKSF